MSSKKVILFIVEGVTDETSIGQITRKLNKDKKVYFQVVTKDITSDYASTTSNILTKVNNIVNDSIREQHFKRNDIIKIIHIVDIDGAFIKDDRIKYKDVPEIEYSSNYIFGKNIDNIKDRNLKKSGILNRLSSTNVINKIPYEIYFFSTNLEHVLHNIQNPKVEEKMKLAEKFEDRFHDKPEDFITFINNKDYALNDTYEKTWEFIKEDNNSLKRYTNFNLFFKW